MLWTMLRAVALRLPPRRLSRAELVLLAFVTVQVLDGVMSYVGVHTFGSWIEANPLVAWYASMFAIGCGTILYLMARHRTVAALTLFYLAFAVVPWVHVLGSYTNV
jgi:hypothetical protein